VLSRQIAAHFAVVAGISIYSVKYALDYSTKLEKGQETLSWAKKMLQLYGPAGVEAAASFLTGLVTTQPVVTRPESDIIFPSSRTPPGVLTERALECGRARRTGEELP